MSKCIIVGSSVDSQKEFSYKEDDFIIASDGGLKFLLEHNYKVDLVVGDFDSLKYIPTGFDMVKLNVIKDVTDTHECIEQGIKRGFKEFEIYGSLGGRIEHSFAIIQEMVGYKKKGIDIRLYAKTQSLFIIHNEKIELDGDGFISIFAYREAKGVTLKNLKYEVNDITLNDDFPLGVSNEFIANKKATIVVKDGYLIIVK